MANVVAKVLGGSARDLSNVRTVGDVKRELKCEGHTATLNAQPATDTQALQDNDYVTLSPAVKGGYNL